MDINPHTLTKIQRAEHAERWTPIIETFRAGRTKKEKRPMVHGIVVYSETCLIVDSTGALIRRGDLMPAPETVEDLRIPAYMRRAR